ncbi:hypothetical protein RO3G_02065 [Lichtheimia corymbifera JMRC:FSU:9682]|uniref:Uncharacterized protein n=1 Tax=Lichtheimia corymbifera JMRC:FSU:9682 TaxID=1263082 RepID=A0A068S9B9_9FUNG|nr:hypothetical protein RO3G_02065 [Lichtheimia corymbifera JMRC:FSU:9682]
MIPITGVAAERSQQNRTAVDRRSSLETQNVAFRRHTRFWDRTNKGYITPIDTATGFMNLGYSVFFSLTFGTFFSVLVAYATHSSWIPDPRCRINVNNLARSKRRRAKRSSLYDEYGNFDSDNFDQLFDKYAQWDLSGNSITLSEVLQMASEQGSYGVSPTAWSRAVVEWCALYLLIGRGGAFQKDDIRAAFDGSLFFKIRETRRPTIKGVASSSAAAVASNNTHGAIHPTDFARMLPQGAVRTLEKQLNAALDTLPRSTLSMIESHFHNWVPGGGDDAMQHNRLVEWGDDEFSGGSNSNSNASSPSLVASTRRRSTLQEQRLTGTKYFSLDNQSFALTGVQGYHGTSSSSYTSDEDTSLSTPESENTATTLPMVMLSGLCPDGMDYYRDTPIKDWIGDSALAGVARSSSAKEALPSPTNMMQPNRKVDLMADLHDDDDDSQDVTLMEPTILSGVMVEKADYGVPSMDDLHVLSPLSSFLRQQNEDSMTSSRLMDNGITSKTGLTGVRYDEASMNEEPVTLSGLLRHDTTTTTTLEPVTLSGLRVDDADGGTRSGFVEAPVDTLSHPKTPPVAMEPIALTGLCSSKDDGSSFFVQEPSSDLAFKRDKVIELEPVKLSGLATSTIANEFSPFVKEPEQDAVFDSQREIDIEPVTLSGLRQENDSFIPFVQEPREDTTTTKVIDMEPIPLSGLRMDDDGSFTPFVKEPADNNDTKIHVVDMEPISLSGLRMDETDGSFTPFVKEPADNNDTKIHVVDMEPVLLSGLRSDETFSTFVQEPSKDDDFESGLQSKKDVDMPATVVLTGLRESADEESADELLDPVDLPCLRTGRDTEYLGFVDVPSDYEPKAPVEVVPVTLSCLRTGPEAATEHAAFVDEPLDYQPKTPPTNLDKVLISCLREDASYASFVEAPLDLEKQPVDLDECAKPVPLSCLRADVGYADFVDETVANTIEKEPVDLDECAKPVALHCLRSDAGYAEFVNATGYERDIEPVTLEVPSFQCLRSKDTEHLGFVSEPHDYKKTVHVPLEPPSTAFLQSDMDHLGFVEAPAAIEQKQYDMEALGQQMDHLSLSGLSKEEGSMEAGRHGDDEEFKIPKEESADPVLLSGLQHQGESIKEQPMETLPTVQLPWKEFEIPMMKFVPEVISLTGMSQQQQIEAPLKNWLNIGNLVGVTADKEMSLYEAPVDMPKEEDVVQEVDLEQYRCAIPLSGVSDSELTISLKNWLNMNALPGTLGSIVSVYESPSSTMPDDYIQPSLDMDDGRSPMLGMIASDEKTLKNWLNMGALSGTVASGLLYEHPIEAKDEPPKLKKSELKQLRKPVPLPGIKNENVHLKNWLNTSALPGIRTTESSRFIYGNPGDDIPTDYIQVQEDMQQELTSLSGTVADIPKTPLKNWLSIDDLPGIQKDNTMIRLYEEAHELDPADYVEPTSSDMEGDVKLTGVVVESEDLISEDDAARRSSMEDSTVHTDFHSEDEHSITTSETSHGPVPLLTSPKHKQQLSNEEWSAMKEIIEQKEE